MSFAYLPWYTGDYLRDTRHLSPLKHGVYLLLLAHCWDQKGPVPLDEQECAGIANCRSHDEIEALRYVLARFFTKMDDGWYNKRMAEEVARAEKISAQNREAGIKSAEIRARIRAANAERALNAGSTGAGIPTPTPILSPRKEEEAKASLSGGSKPKPREELEAARRLLAYLNEKAERNFKPVEAHLRMIQMRVKEHGEESLKLMIAMKVREWRTDEKMREFLRPGTLFNATRCADYVGRVGTFNGAS